MAYIGAQPRLGNFQACDAITTSATTTFNLLVGGTAIFPQSAQHCLVSLNGVLQAPISSYTISGSTIIFAAALTTDDSIDFITILGDTLDLGTPSDSTVTTAKLNTAVLTGATDIGAAIADADLFLVDDGAGGTLRKTAASRLKTYIGGGITNAQQWRVTTTFTGNADPITANWEEADTYGYGRLGTTMASSSGVFTFPSTGFWYIQTTITHIEGSSELQYGVAKINATTNNSSYNDIAVSYNSVKVDGGYQTTTASAVMDITNTSTHKVSLSSNANHSSTSTMGDSNLNRTYVTFIRLGDT